MIMYTYKKCFHIENIIEFSRGIELLMEKYGVRNIDIEILDKGVHIYMNGKSFKRIRVSYEKIRKTFTDDIVYLKSKKNSDTYEPSDDEICSWPIFVDDTMIRDISNRFVVFHSYAIGLLFLFSMDNIDLYYFNDFLLDKNKFINVINRPYGSPKNRMIHVDTLLKKENFSIDTFFST